MRAVATALRAGARAAAPALSAERSVLARNLTVLASRTAPKAAAAVTVQCRQFAKKVEQEPDLHGLLLSEADFEAENAEVDQEFEEVKKKILKSFQLKTKPGQGTVELVGSHGDEKITITFDCQDEVDTSDFVGEDLDIEHDEEEELEGSRGVNFVVEIEKKGEKMLFGCIAADTNDVLISQVRHVPAGESVQDTEAYGGPMVETLDPELTHLLTEYLAERKIDADMSYFISQYAQQKESEEYVNFCRKFAEFLKK